jgi:hypothetical protein
LPEILLQDDKNPDPALHTSEYLAMVKIKDDMLSFQVEELGRELIREAIDERVSWLLYEKNKISVHSIIANPSHSIAEEVYDTFVKEFVQDITIECLAERATMIRLGYYVLPSLEDTQIPECIRAIVHECESDMASNIIAENMINDALPLLISEICNVDIKSLEGKQTDQNQTFAMDQLVIRVGIEQLISMLSDISKHEEDAAILEGEKEKLAFVYYLIRMSK